MLRSWIAGGLICALLGACSGERPAHLGVRGGQLAPCPDRPNCVSSFAGDPEHYVAPLLFSAPAPEVMRRVKAALKKMDRVTLVEEKPNYIYAEFTSRVFRFVDDVEFYLDEKTGTLHFRSASRLGYSDLGVNRERIETIKRLLEATDRFPSTT